MIRFHKPYGLLKSQKYLLDVLSIGRTEGDGKYTHLCQSWLKNKLSMHNILLMTSGTHALECACHCLNLTRTDEVIMPSYNFPSAANAVLLAGGNIVFSEVESKRLTLDPKHIEEKITDKTKAIMVIHYGGFLADMDAIMQIARKHNLQVIEDGAQSFLNPSHRTSDQLGDYICYSFHGTKDVVSGEGGALYVKNDHQYAYAKRFRQKGTNRDEFFNGIVNFYEWTNLGSSYSPSELSMALLYSQLELSQTIVDKNRKIFHQYQYFFEQKKYKGIFYSKEEENYKTNGHTFYLIFNDRLQAKQFKEYMLEQLIEVRTHFVPLAESHMAKDHFKIASLKHSAESDLGQSLIRLPIYPDLEDEAIRKILISCDSFLGEGL